jgi:hypothetical protein
MPRAAREIPDKKAVRRRTPFWCIRQVIGFCFAKNSGNDLKIQCNFIAERSWQAVRTSNFF